MEVTADIDRSFDRLAARLDAAIAVSYTLLAEKLLDPALPDTAELRAPYQKADWRPSATLLQEDAQVSSWLIKLLPVFAKAVRSVPVEHRTPFIRATTKFIFSLIGQKVLSLDDSNSKPSSPCCIHAICAEQLYLDIHLFMLLIGAHSDDSLIDAAVKLCDSAFQMASRNLPENLSLHPEDWFDRRARKLLSQYAIIL